MSPREQSKFAEAICCLAKEIGECRKVIENEIKWARSHHGLATTKELQELGKKIIMALNEQAKNIKGYFERVEKGIDGLTVDVTTLTEKIAALQASNGAVTPEDQALIDEIETIGDRVATKTEALDALNQPVVPS